jgi:hypothetical protein
MTTVACWACLEVLVWSSREGEWTDPDGSTACQATLEADEGPWPHDPEEYDSAEDAAESIRCARQSRQAQKGEWLPKEAPAVDTAVAS